MNWQQSNRKKFSNSFSLMNYSRSKFENKLRQEFEALLNTQQIKELSSVKSCLSNDEDDSIKHFLNNLDTDSVVTPRLLAISPASLSQLSLKYYLKLFWSQKLLESQKTDKCLENVEKKNSACVHVPDQKSDCNQLSVKKSSIDKVATNDFTCDQTVYASNPATLGDPGKEKDFIKTINLDKKLTKDEKHFFYQPNDCSSLSLEAKSGNEINVYNSLLQSTHLKIKNELYLPHTPNNHYHERNKVRVRWHKVCYEDGSSAIFSDTGKLTPTLIQDSTATETPTSSPHEKKSKKSRKTQTKKKINKLKEKTTKKSLSKKSIKVVSEEKPLLVPLFFPKCLNFSQNLILSIPAESFQPLISNCSEECRQKSISENDLNTDWQKASARVTPENKQMASSPSRRVKFALSEKEVQ